LRLEISDFKGGGDGVGKGMGARQPRSRNPMLFKRKDKASSLCEDYLRQRGLAQWPREDARRAELIAARPATADDVAAWASDVHGQDGQSGQHGRGKTETESTECIQSTKSTYAEISANGALALLAVACSLLDRQIATLEKNFVEEGGFTERLYRVRSQRRTRG